MSIQPNLKTLQLWISSTNGTLRNWGFSFGSHQISLSEGGQCCTGHVKSVWKGPGSNTVSSFAQSHEQRLLIQNDWKLSLPKSNETQKQFVFGQHYERLLVSVLFDVSFWAFQLGRVRLPRCPSTGHKGWNAYRRSCPRTSGVKPPGKTLTNLGAKVGFSSFKKTLFQMFHGTKWKLFCIGFAASTERL